MPTASRLGSSSVLPLALLVACSGGDASSPTPPPSAGGVTWYEDVAPLVSTYCLSCHVAGGVAPFALDSYASAKAWGASVTSTVERRIMPPYYVTNDGSCEEYRSPWLSDEEIATFTAWAAGGYQEGDPANAPDPYTPPPGLGSSATTYAMPATYTPLITGNPGATKDDYRCFILSDAREADRFVTALEVVPGNTTIVHHALIYTVDPTQEVTQTSTGEVKTNEEVITDLMAEGADRGGWPCYGSTGEGTLPNGLLGTWAPGTGVLRMPEGTGVSLREGDWVVAQVHYNLDYGAGSDRSSVKLELADSVTKEGFFIAPDGLLQTLYDGDPFIIEPGEANVSFSWTGEVQDLIDYIDTYFPDRFETAPTSFDIYGLAPHMHQLGARFQVKVRDQASGDERCLLDMPEWDFNWQHFYLLKAPVTLTAQDASVVTCTWDSRGQVAPAFPGYNSTDEMCLLGVYFTAH